METWHVYQLRSDTELLYVGYTREKLKRRLAAHRRRKPWWPEVTEVRSEKFATEDEARQREKETWASEQPKYNRQNPFLTTEERDAIARARVREWKANNAERWREQGRERQRRYMSDPVKHEAHKASQRESDRRRRARRWQQPGPGLF